MKNENLIIGLVVEESTSITFLEVCQRYHIPQELLLEMIEQGLFPDQPSDPQKFKPDQKALRRMESAFRLHRDLGVNLPGVALALDLLEEIEKMRHELEILRKHF